MKRLTLLFLILIGIPFKGFQAENLINDKDTTFNFVDSITNGKTFKVSEVIIADSLMKTDSALKIIENKIGKEIIFFPEEHQNLELVYCPNNGLIQTLQECYDNHRPLVLSPDVIWLAICQGVSIHINENYNSLKNKIFIDNKPDKIIVRNDSLEYSGKHWASLVASFSEETKKYTKDDFYSFFVSNFSTTTAVERTAYQITLLESYKKAFEYVGDSGCGIPSITLKGNKEDWQTILSKLDQLNGIGLSNWAENLKPLINEFIKVYDNEINIDFWNSIYKNASEYNAFYISGWIIKFFPYTKELDNKGVFDENRGEMRYDEVFKQNEYLNGSNYLISTLSTDNFPSGLAKISVTWRNFFKNEIKEMEVYSGFFAIKQFSDKSLEPFISWSICEKDAKSKKHKIVSNKNLKLAHTNDIWAPSIVSTPKDLAIYNCKKFKSQKESVDFIRAKLRTAISMNKKYSTIKIAGDTLEIVVLSNGTIGKVTLLGKDKNVALEDFIIDQINGLPEKWFPALSNPSDVLEWDFTEEENKYKVKVNSLVTIIL